MSGTITEMNETTGVENSSNSLFPLSILSFSSFSLQWNNIQPPMTLWWSCLSPRNHNCCALCESLFFILPFIPSPFPLLCFPLPTVLSSSCPHLLYPPITIQSPHPPSPLSDHLIARLPLSHVACCGCVAMRGGRWLALIPVHTIRHAVHSDLSRPSRMHTQQKPTWWRLIEVHTVQTEPMQRSNSIWIIENSCLLY